MKRIETTSGKAFFVGTFKGKHIGIASKLNNEVLGQDSDNLQLCMLAAAGVVAVNESGSETPLAVHDLLELDGLDALELIAAVLGK